MGYPRNIRHLEGLEDFDLILAMDQDLGFFTNHRKAPENRNFVALPRDLARVLLIPITTQCQYASWDDIEFTSSSGKRLLILWRYQETFYWEDLLDSNERYFRRRHVRVVGRLPDEAIKAIKDQLGEITL